MSEIKIKGKLLYLFNKYGISGFGPDYPEAEILVSPLELLEQIPHRQIGELLALINLPQQSQPKEIEELNYCFADRDHRVLGNKIEELIQDRKLLWQAINSMRKGK